MCIGRRKNLGDLHADTLQSINNLGMLKHAAGDDKTAESLLREALEGRKQTVYMYMYWLVYMSIQYSSSINKYTFKILLKY